MTGRGRATRPMSLTTSQIRSVQRPVHSLWSWAIEALALRLGAQVANRTAVTPMALTWIAFALGLAAAGCFLEGGAAALIAGAVLYQLSDLADALDGMVARAKPGSGSVFALLADHVLDAWRLLLALMALAWGQYRLQGDASLFFWAALFLAVHFADWTEPRTIHKLRRAYGGATKPRLEPADRGLLRLKSRLERWRMRAVFFSVREREAVVFLLGPLTGEIKLALIAGTGLTLVFLLFRLRLDHAMLKNEIVTGAQEYLGDAQNPWERGLQGPPTPRTTP